MEILSFFGPLLAAIGAFLMAYDVARGPVRQAREKSLNKQLELHNESLNSSLEIYKSLTDSYDPESIKELIDEAQDRANRVIRRSQDAYAEFIQNEQNASFKFAARGFLLVAFGSVFQAIPPFAEWLCLYYA